METPQTVNPAQESAPVETAPLQAQAPAAQAMETQTVEGAGISPFEGEGAVMGFDGMVVLFTWIAFLIAFVVLGKFLWKPIMRYLESREEEIRSSLDDAAAARKAAEEADAKAAQTMADAERDARAKADEIAAATRKHIAEMETEAREAIAAKRRAADVALEEERSAAMRKLSEKAGGEIAAALERMLPGLLTDAQRQDYQDKIAADVRLG